MRWGLFSLLSFSFGSYNFAINAKWIIAIQIVRNGYKFIYIFKLADRKVHTNQLDAIYVTIIISVFELNEWKEAKKTVQSAINRNVRVKYPVS